MESSADKVNAVRVRSFVPGDREAVRQIALSTAMMGNPADIFFDGGDVLADALTSYFTDHEPGSSFVAESDGRVVGYIIGARDTRAMDVFFQKRLLLPLLGKVITSGLLLRRKNLYLMVQFIKAVLTGRMQIPDFYSEYPATLHINLVAQARGTGAGGQLMDRYLEYLKAQGICGVRMATMSEAAGKFFESREFKVLYRSSRPYFHHIIGRDVPLLIYGRKLT